MNIHTIDLLKECSSGCEMAMKSIAQVKEYVKDESLEHILDRYSEEHYAILTKVATMLGEDGLESEEPSKLAEAMSWLTTEVKMLMRADSHQIAKLMMDGCNMGIQSVSEYINKYDDASEESEKIAGELIRIEEEFMKELKAFV